MKTFTKYALAVAGLAVLAFASCKKDEQQVVATTGTPGTLAVSATTFTVSSATAANNATTFSWSNADFGYSAATTYSLEFDRKGNNFSAPVSVALSSGSSKVYTVGDVNALAIQAGFAPDKAAQLEARLKASVSSAYTPVYSNAVTLNFTPYRAFVNYPSLYVPGVYQDWDPATAPTLASVKSDNYYEGYVNYPAGKLEFKINSNPDWSHTNYGLTAGKLDAKNNDNITVPSAGYYLLTVNMDTKAYTSTRINAWSINGTATNNADQNLTYDATTKAWRGTFNLAAGTFKFRANNANNIVLGDKTPVTTFLTSDNPAAITIASTGTYQIVLNLSVSGNYYYEINKQ
jgi:hypothetical protein